MALCKSTLLLLVLLGLAIASPQFQRRGRGQSSVTRGRQAPRTGGRSPSGRSGGARAGGGTRGGQSNRLIKQQGNKISCPEPDGFFADPGQCDKYYQCTEGVAKEKMCPDGLLFHPNRTYPCVYPVEVDCGPRTRQQDAQPTEGCPRQYALFRTTEDPGTCGNFTTCINGLPYPGSCPETLAFNSRSLNCEWADDVEECDASAYLNFNCEQKAFTPEQVNEYTTYPHPNDCTKYYVCLNKEDGSVQPRLQSCSLPGVFDREKGSCNDNPAEVPGCENAVPPEIVKEFLKRKAAEEERREARLLELKEKLQG